VLAVVDLVQQVRGREKSAATPDAPDAPEAPR